MIRTVVTGVAGRMGSLIARKVLSSTEHVLVGATEAPGGPWIGRDAGEAAGRSPCGVLVRASLTEALADGADVVIDLSRAEAALENALACAGRGVALVLGTTGLTPEMRAELAQLSSRMPLIVAANLSLGVNVLLALVEQAAQALGPGFDLEVLELHHRHKRDAPSGTALALGQTAARGAGLAFDDAACYARHGLIGERPAGAIGLQTLRGGDVAGEHTVYLLGEAERLELTHRATSREPFATGALRAARFLAGRPPGLYTMAQALGLA